MLQKYKPCRKLAGFDYVKITYFSTQWKTFLKVTRWQKESIYLWHLISKKELEAQEAPINQKEYR